MRLKAVSEIFQFKIIETGRSRFNEIEIDLSKQEAFSKLLRLIETIEYSKTYFLSDQFECLKDGCCWFCFHFKCLSLQEPLYFFFLITF